MITPPTTTNTRTNASKKAGYYVISGLIIISIFAAGFFIGNQRGVSATYSKINDYGADLGLFWRAWEVLQDNFPFTEEVPDTQEKVYGAIEGLARSYGDPHTTFFSPKDAEEFNTDVFTGEFSGVGMEIGIRNSTLTVIAPLKGTPAEQAGVLPGDVIFRVNGEIVSDLSVDEAVDLIRGPRGSEVVLTVFRADRIEPVDITIVRDTITIPTLDTTEVDDVFIIALYNFNAKAAEQFATALNDFANSGKHKLIVDLRNNPGGFLSHANDIAGWFLPTGKVIVTESFGDPEQTGKEPNVFRSAGSNLTDLIDQPLEMVILVNSGSASASEIVAGALQEHGIATLVGTPTFGKGSVQQFIDLPQGAGIKVTIARWLTPNGNQIEGVGLMPDEVVERSTDDYLNGRDPQMDRALEILSGN